MDHTRAELDQTRAELEDEKTKALLKEEKTHWCDEKVSGSPVSSPLRGHLICSKQLFHGWNEKHCAFFV
jgi:hypothetical protein